jgi:hypothetical protein
MFDRKFLITLIGLILAVLAISQMPSAAPLVEGFWGDAGFTTKIIHNRVDLNDQFVTAPAFQAPLEPRMNPIGYSAVYSQPPARKHLAVPADPLTFSNLAMPDNGPVAMSTENFDDFAEAPVPVGDMTQVDALGKVVQPVVYDRLIYANRNSRLRSRGDWIRGDLAIAPRKGDWFQVAVNPSIDLNQGALNVLAGEQNEQGRSLTNFIQRDSDGAQTAIAGVNMGNEFRTELGNNSGDINVRSY